ncbi:hypothetical protein T484DRAFT_3599908 [Baffinella frigidus]|nr:hypothetical protein T484DRAFT_3599908 [Cryptophyta sp. CCMP2293]
MRVGACMPAYPPFTYSDKTGYDIENWWRVYEIMNGQIRSDAIPAQVAALGSTRPTMEFYPFSTVMAMVENNTLDVGMCGIYALAERSKQFDFAPPYHVSALRVLVPAGNSLTEDDLSLQLVFRSMYYKVSSVAVFSLLSLLYCSMLFAHIFWLVERHTNRSIPRNYGKGVFEGMWLGIVTAATIGYGDITPSTRVGKLVSMAWILWGTLLIAMFSAAITSSLIANEDVVMKEVLKQPLVQSLQDLETSRIGGNFDAAREAILQHFPTSNFSMFGGQTESYEALLRGEADALIEDGASARLLTNKKDSPYAGKFELVQQVALEERQSCIIVSRSGGVSNPLFQPIVYAQLREMNRGGGTPFKALKAVWFGAGNAESPDERLAKSKTVYQDYLTRINLTGGVILGGV